VSEIVRAERWGDKSVTRRDIVKFLGVGAGIILGSQLAEVIVNDAVDERVRGPHWPVDQWIRLPQPDADQMPWRTFRGDRGYQGWLRITDTTYDAGILLVPRENMDAQAAQLPETAQPAAVWYPGGNEIELATVPWDIVGSDAFPNHYSVGMGVREGNLKATMGMYVPEIRSLTLVEGVADAGMVRTYDMPQKFPGVQWV
jgi:hypothetical protein